jgi:hydrogenase expression/formation protein HypC
MCLGVPGRVMSVVPGPGGMDMGTVSFGGVTREVCLAYTPGVKPGDYVVVHVGFSISQVSEQEAEEVFRTLRELGELGELDAPQEPA